MKRSLEEMFDRTAMFMRGLRSLWGVGKGVYMNGLYLEGL